MQQPEAKASHCCRHEGCLPLGLCIPHCSKEQEEVIHIDQLAGPVEYTVLHGDPAAVQAGVKLDQIQGFPSLFHGHFDSFFVNVSKKEPTNEGFSGSCTAVDTDIYTTDLVYIILLVTQQYFSRGAQLEFGTTQHFPGWDCCSHLKLWCVCAPICVWAAVNMFPVKNY